MADHGSLPGAERQPGQPPDQHQHVHRSDEPEAGPHRRSERLSATSISGSPTACAIHAARDPAHRRRYLRSRCRPTACSTWARCRATSIIGPGFSNVDLSVIKNIALRGTARVQLRVETFNLFNRANLGQPGRIATVGSTSFGVITNTRFPTGDSGSSRQVQFAAKFLF